MAYGGISPETPLTLSLSVSRPTTQQSSTTATTFDIAEQFPLADNSTLPTTAIASIQLESQVDGGDLLPVGKHTNPPHKGLAQPWSRPSSSGGSSISKGARPVSSMHFLLRELAFRTTAFLCSDHPRQSGEMPGESEGSRGWSRAECIHCKVRIPKS